MSHSEKVPIQRAAMITLQCEFIEERWSRNGGEATTRYELEDYQQAAKQPASNVACTSFAKEIRNVTPNLANYLRSNDVNVTDDNVIDEAAVLDLTERATSAEKESLRSQIAAVEAEKRALEAESKGVADRQANLQASYDGRLLGAGHYQGREGAVKFGRVDAPSAVGVALRAFLSRIVQRRKAQLPVHTVALESKPQCAMIRRLIRGSLANF